MTHPRIDPSDLPSAFLREGPALAAAIREGARTLDLERVQRAARRLRALAMGVDAEWLDELCRDLDVRIRFDRFNGTAELLARIEREHERVRRSLELGRRDDVRVIGWPSTDGTA